MEVCCLPVEVIPSQADIQEMELALNKQNGAEEEEVPSNPSEVLRPVYIPPITSATTTEPTSVGDEISKKNQHHEKREEHSQLKEATELVISEEESINTPLINDHEAKDKADSGLVTRTEAKISETSIFRPGMTSLAASIAASLLLGGLAYYSYPDTDAADFSSRSGNVDDDIFDKGARVVHLSDLTPREWARLEGAHAYRVSARSGGDDSLSYYDLAVQAYNAVVPTFMKIAAQHNKEVKLAERQLDDGSD